MCFKRELTKHFSTLCTARRCVRVSVCVLIRSRGFHPVLALQPQPASVPVMLLQYVYVLTGHFIRYNF